MHKVRSELILSTECRNPGYDPSVKNLSGSWGAWVAHLFKCLTSAQIMTSQFVSLSTTLGSALTVKSLLGILSVPLSLPPAPSSFSQNK